MDKFEKLRQITKGHVLELLNQEEQLHKERIGICKGCPLWKETKIGPICDPEKSIKYNNEEVFGCGCRLEAKTRLQEAECIVKKW